MQWWPCKIAFLFRGVVSAVGMALPGPKQEVLQTRNSEPRTDLESYGKRVPR